MAWKIPCSSAVLAAALLAVAAAPLQAQDTPKRNTALSLLGKPKQPEGFKNFDWVNPDAPKGGRVRMSAIGAAHDAPSRNGRLHALSDAELQRSGLRWTILRPHFFMQNLFATVPTIAAQGSIFWDMASGSLGMIDARDIGDFAARILLAAPHEHDQAIYTLTGPAAVTLGDAATAIGDAMFWAADAAR